MHCSFLRLPIGLFLAGTALAAETGPMLPAPIIEMLDAARAQGLPTEVLEGKAREGLAKGVPEPRVAAALGVMSASLATSQGALGAAPVDVVVAGARALGQGASVRSLGRTAALPAALQGPALHSVADLLGVGFSEDQSVRMVESAARSPDPARSLSDLATAAGALVARGASFVAAADRVEQEVSSGRSSFFALGGLGPPDHSNAGGLGPPDHSNAGGDGPPEHSNAGGNGNGNGNGNGGNR